MAKKKVIGAFDLGASGGKFFIGTFDREKFSMEEVHRFDNNPVNLYLTPESEDSSVHKIYWNDLSIYAEMLNGLRKLRHLKIEHLDCLGVDTWGTDGECFTKNGEIAGRVHNYRDHRLDKIRDKLFKLLPERELFQLTGVPSYPFNQVNQLFWLVNERPDLFKVIDYFLPIPSIFYYYLCGARICEYTWISTTQLIDPHKKTWSEEVFKKLGIPVSFMPDIVKPGARIGTLHEELARDTGINRFELIATATHDTACAYVAAPVENEEDSLIISSGTWSLVGKLIPEPIINDVVYKNRFTNEGGVGNIRFLKNVMGTWIVQELRRLWSEQARAELSWEKIVQMTEKGESFSAFIDPDDASFYNPADMEDAIKKFCGDTGQKIPGTRETTLRIVYESLAMKYRVTNEMIEEMTGKKNERVYVVGGGAKNSLLNQFTAEATGLPVIAGPFEATAIGNILIQAKTVGAIRNLREGAELVKQSIPVDYYKGKDIDRWDKAAEKFKGLVRNNAG